MDTVVEKRRISVPKLTKEDTVIPLKKRGLLGILKGKIHCDDAIVFNLN